MFARKGSVKRDKLRNGNFGNDKVPGALEFVNEWNESFRYKLKKDGIKVSKNGVKQGMVVRFELTEELELDDGFNTVLLPRTAAQHEILPKLARMARYAGVSGLERYYLCSKGDSHPGREWRVSTHRGIYVRETFTTTACPVDTLEHGEILVEIEAKQIDNQLWICHKDGWCLASTQLRDGTSHDLLSPRMPTLRTKTKKSFSRGKRESKSSRQLLKIRDNNASVPRAASEGGFLKSVASVYASAFPASSAVSSKPKPAPERAILDDDDGNSLFDERILRLERRFCEIAI
eukprot:CAMPEP_0167796946 /NCGR_PEP_ID=MMETSP0111_2-20121227/15355_1 /TAXON_ID=91324 /ORGANISM="Lotharella globosa, Strain CCCM811" /LENGTH=289 /DNA_ID=CAMNT_0007690945 /DNA_START=57 /DNA_END=926 /DNA_ORIENTATION=+